MFRQFSIAVLSTALLASSVAPAFAIDLVTRKSAKNVSGDITEITKSEITIKTKSGGKEDILKIPANDIVSIKWGGSDPTGLSSARTDESSDRLEKALKGYQDVIEKLKSEASPHLKTDLDFLVLRTSAKLALTDPTKLDEAIKKMETFKTKNAESYNYYECLSYLGELYVAKKDFVKARVTFDSLGKAPWKDYQMASKIAVGRMSLLENKPDEAASAFDAVIAMGGDSAQEQSQRFEAMLGKARILIKQSKFDEGLKVVEEVVEKASPEDARVQAEAHLRQGDCLQGLNKDKDAILSYLVIDVLFASQRQQEAEALYNLARLWAKDGKADRGNEARDKLQSEFPKSEWLQQLKAPAAAPAAAGG